MNLIYPKPGFVEIDPEQLWNSIVKTIQDAVKGEQLKDRKICVLILKSFLIVILDAKLEISDILCLGISTQRSTFVTWDKVTGQTFHNFVTWKDIRADSLVKKWNSSFIIKVKRFSETNSIY